MWQVNSNMWICMKNCIQNLLSCFPFVCRTIFLLSIELRDIICPTWQNCELMEITPKIGYFTSSILCGYQISLFLLVGKWVEKEKNIPFPDNFSCWIGLCYQILPTYRVAQKRFSIGKKSWKFKSKMIQRTLLPWSSWQT